MSACPFLRRGAGFNVDESLGTCTSWTPEETGYCVHAVLKEETRHTVTQWADEVRSLEGPQK